jgi:hypothetical protein
MERKARKAKNRKVLEPDWPLSVSPEPERRVIGVTANKEVKHNAE